MATPRVILRCDASPAMGAGHVARCMALARALRGRGAQVELLARQLPPRIREHYVDGHGVTVHLLPTPADNGADPGPALTHASWLDTPQSADARACLAAMSSGPRPAWLVVDHYALDVRWEAHVRPAADGLLAIDDLADRVHDCDLLLDQNLHAANTDPAGRYAGKVSARTELLLGPRYALQRPEFATARQARARHDGRIRRVFVCFGGFDAAGQTLRAVEALAAARFEDFEVDVAVGSDHPSLPALRAACAATDGFALHVDTADLCTLMARADLAIGASGSMNWERAALGLPSIVVSVADNQHRVAEALAERLGCLYLGDGSWAPGALAALVTALRHTPSLVAALGRQASEIADGEGARRVADRLLPRDVALRAAGLEDCDTVHAWRNAEEARLGAFDPAPIPLEAHRAWYRRVLADPGTSLLVGETHGRPAGVLRFDVCDAIANVSVYLTPGIAGRGVGTALLRAGTSWLRQNRPGVREVRAEIRPDNLRSAGAFAAAGYHPYSHSYRLELGHA